jgi:hypothetical protein
MEQEVEVTHLDILRGRNRANIDGLRTSLRSAVTVIERRRNPHAALFVHPRLKTATPSTPRPTRRQYCR